MKPLIIILIILLLQGVCIGESLELTHEPSHYIILVEIPNGKQVGILMRDGKFDLDYSDTECLTECAKVFFDEVVKYANSYYTVVEKK